MCFLNVAFHPSPASFYTTFLRDCGGGVTTSGLPHVIKLLLEVSKCLLPEKYFSPINSIFVSVEFFRVIRLFQH